MRLSWRCGCQRFRRETNPGGSVKAWGGLTLYELFQNVSLWWIESWSRYQKPMVDERPKNTFITKVKKATKDEE